MASLQVLTGLKITKIEKVHDYIQFVFTGCRTLSIYNNYVYDGGSELCIEGKTVSAVKECDRSVLIRFQSGESLSVGLDDGDYNGPEAMVFIEEGKPPIVWT